MTQLARQRRVVAQNKIESGECACLPQSGVGGQVGVGIGKRAANVVGELRDLCAGQSDGQTGNLGGGQARFASRVSPRCALAS